MKTYSYKGWEIVKEDNACWGHDPEEGFARYEYHVYAPGKRDQSAVAIELTLALAKAHVDLEVAK